MFGEPPIYKTYILRFWEERDTAVKEQPSVWRFSLFDPETEKRYGFGSWEEVTAFIEKQQNQTH
ncbi:MAG: hypothetical protein GY805_05595 [Chloroflexi bacterium]|nr:hypothetical protein [Chloroflexota bacterium]